MLCCSAVPPVGRCAVVCVVSCCGVLRCLVCTGCCRIMLPVASGCSVLGLADRCCLWVACLVAGGPVWPRGLLRRCVLLFVVVPCSPVLCRLVLVCGALLSVCFAALVCTFPIPVFAVLCWRACVVRFAASLICAVSGVSCCGAWLCAVLFLLAFSAAVVLPCCVVWCVVVSCSAVLCPVLLCCLVVPCCRAVLCVSRSVCGCCPLFHCKMCFNIFRLSKI